MIYIFPITMLIFLSAFNLVVIRAIISDDTDSINRKKNKNDKYYASIHNIFFYSVCIHVKACYRVTTNISK